MADTNILGLENLYRKLKSIDTNASNILKESIEKCTVFVADDAVLRAPIDTGDLRYSIDYEVKQDGDDVKGSVFTNSDHAAYVEFGTGQKGEETNTNTNVDVSYRQDWSGMPAQPYLYPALKDNEDDIKKEITHDLRKAIKEIARR